MLYNKGYLSQKQAEKIIGEKMLARIEHLNEWLQKNDYVLLLHSTTKGNVEGIFTDGLWFPTSSSIDTRDELLCDSNITEKDLSGLEAWASNNKGKTGKLNKLYETYMPIETATVVWFSQISAKDMLEYNHKGGDATVVFCVPKKEIQKIGKDVDDKFRAAFSRSLDPYLRRAIFCRQEKGAFEYKSQYFYPTEGILFAFDRDNVLIKFNGNYDETYYLDKQVKNHAITKGQLFNMLKNVDNSIQKPAKK